LGLFFFQIAVFGAKSGEIGFVLHKKVFLCALVLAEREAYLVSRESYLKKRISVSRESYLKYRISVSRWLRFVGCKARSPFD